MKNLTLTRKRYTSTGLACKGVSYKRYDRTRKASFFFLQNACCRTTCVLLTGKNGYVALYIRRVQSRIGRFKAWIILGITG